MDMNLLLILIRQMGTGKTCLGGGIHCPGTSSFICMVPLQTLNLKLTANVSKYPVSFRYDIALRVIFS